MAADQAIDYSSYGRKENEGKDLNEDTNFGKLKRIPYAPLQQYIKPDNFLLSLKKSKETPDHRGSKEGNQIQVLSFLAYLSIITDKRIIF